MSTLFVPQPGLTAARNLRQLMADKMKGNTIMANEPATQAAPATALPEGWILSQMEVSKNEKGADGNAKRVSLGKVAVPMPTLAAYGITAEQEQEDGKPALNENGIPVYKLPELDFLQSSIRAAIYITARNRLISNTMDLQPGKAFLASFADMATLGDRDGTHLVNRAACINSFAGFIANQGKPANIVDNWKRLMRDPASMASQVQGIKDKMQGYLGEFIKTLSAEELEKYMPTITAADDASKATAPSVEEM